MEERTNEYEFDWRDGRVLEVRRTKHGLGWDLYSNVNGISFGRLDYDQQGLYQGVQDEWALYGTDTRYLYDAAGHLTEVVRAYSTTNEREASEELIASFDYDAQGRLLRQECKESYYCFMGEFGELSYDDAERVVLNTMPSGSVGRWVYDEQGAIVRRQGLQEDGTWWTGAQCQEENGRRYVVQWPRPDDPDRPWASVWEVDAFGNPLSYSNLEIYGLDHSLNPYGLDRYTATYEGDACGQPLEFWPVIVPRPDIPGGAAWRAKTVDWYKHWPVSSP